MVYGDISTCIWLQIWNLDLGPVNSSSRQKCTNKPYLHHSKMEIACQHLLPFREQDWRAHCGSLILGQLARSWGMLEGLAASSRAQGAVKTGCSLSAPRGSSNTLSGNSLHIKGASRGPGDGHEGLQYQCKAAWAGLAVCSHMVLDCTFPQTSCTSQINTYWAKLRNTSF